MSALVEEGWIAPANPGPRTRFAISTVAASLLLFTAWSLLPAGNLDRLRGTATAPAATVIVREDGSATLRGRPLRTEVRTVGDTRFLVISGEAPPGSRVRVSAPAGVERERIAVRVLAGASAGERASFLVTIPSRGLPALDQVASAGELHDRTTPLDRRIAAARADQRLLVRLRDGWWWIVPLGAAGTVLPLLLWRRTARRWFSMRLPGAGGEPSTVPPSSLDPVGAAVLVAGARPVDEAAAFAGHVLDLVERHQLRLRRNTSPEVGAIGAQIGLAHADEQGEPDDPAVDALRGVAHPDGLSVDVPDEDGTVAQIAPAARAAWSAHVAGRSRFERVAVAWRWRRVAMLAGAVVTAGCAAVLLALVAPLDGERAAATLVAAVALPAGLVLAAWALDARRWRIIARGRRTERAQWLAWRGAVAAAGARGLDPRNIPLVAATGPAEGILPERVPATAVALEAVTTRTVRALRAMYGGER